MSHTQNTIYDEMVLGYIEDNAGTVGGKLLQYYWDNKDHDGIELTLAQIRKEDFEREYRPEFNEYKRQYPLGNIGFNLDGVPF